MMVGDSDAEITRQAADVMASPDGGDRHSPLEMLIGDGESQRVGRFRFFLDGQRWEWSDAVARMHGYQPGAVQPTTELLLQHKHPDDRSQVEQVLDRVRRGEPFSSRHRIIDTGGHAHWVIVVGDRTRDDTGAVTGTAGFYVDITEALQSEVSAALSEVSESRAVIEQAKGVLMAAYSIPADRAFDILVWRSQETNVKLRDLAGRFMDHLAGTLPEDTLSLIDHTLLTVE